MNYPQNETALLLVDPLNDFMSRLGKGRPLVRKVSMQVNLLHNLEKLSDTFRGKGWPVFYAPHHRYRRGSFGDQKYLHPTQMLQKLTHFFKADAFGGNFFPRLKPQPEDIVASEHDCSSGFMGTDLHEKLQSKGISHIVIAGFLSNTCIESTARSAIDLGYHVTLLEDAVAAWTPKDQWAAVKLNYPHIAHELTNTEGLIKSIGASNV